MSIITIDQLWMSHRCLGPPAPLLYTMLREKLGQRAVDKAGRPCELIRRNCSINVHASNKIGVGA